MTKPDYLSQGESVRLFPVLSTTSKEGRTTSIVLACTTLVREFGAELLGSLGHKLGIRSRVSAYTEVVFKGTKNEAKERPDGLIIVTNGGRQWKALVEAKVGNNSLEPEQIEKYRVLAKTHNIDCVITISNQFATTPSNHPLVPVLKSRSKIPVFHWSWMFIRTTAELLINNNNVKDDDQSILLSELVRFLTHESAGVKGFDRMPPEWGELNRLISAGGKVTSKSTEANAVIDAWHQETKDLSLILSRQTETNVTQKIARRLLTNPSARQREELSLLREKHQLEVNLDVPGAAAPLNIIANIDRRTIEVGMSIRAPEDRKSSKARLNWLLRQLKSENDEDVHVRLTWPGRSEATTFPLADLRNEPELCETGKEGLQVLAFHVYVAKRLGARFTQQSNFIAELESLVPSFYMNFGQELSAWVKPAPKIRKSEIELVEVNEAGSDETT